MFFHMGGQGLYLSFFSGKMSILWNTPRHFLLQPFSDGKRLCLSLSPFLSVQIFSGTIFSFAPNGSRRGFCKGICRLFPRGYGKRDIDSLGKRKTVLSHLSVKASAGFLSTGDDFCPGREKIDLNFSTQRQTLRPSLRRDYPRRRLFFLFLTIYFTD